MNARRIINSQFGFNFAYSIGRYTPYPLGYRFAILAAKWIASRRTWKIVRATRLNQWIVRGESLDKASLDKIVDENFRNIACSIYDYYHYLSSPAASMRAIQPHPYANYLVQRKEFERRGLVIAGIHLSNFDMAFQAGGLAGIRALLFTLPSLNEGYQKQWELRSKSGIKFVSASVGSLKLSIDHLKAGGVIATGIDRPDESSPYRIKFFNHQAALPIHHVFLALKAKVPVVVAGIIRQPDGKYWFRFSELIEMQAGPDRQSEIVLNAEKVLRTVEELILADPCQWSMTYPVWPELLDQTP